MRNRERGTFASLGAAVDDQGPNLEALHPFNKNVGGTSEPRANRRQSIQSVAAPQISLSRQLPEPLAH